MEVGDGRGLVCGDGTVWAGEVPIGDPWKAAGFGGCSVCAGVDEGAMWWIPWVDVGGLEVLWAGGGCMYMAGSNWIGVWEVTSAYVRSSVVEVGELTVGKGSRAACGCEEVEVTADFWRYGGSVRSPLSEGREDSWESDTCACSGDEEVDAGGGGWCMSGAALVRSWGRE